MDRTELLEKYSESIKVGPKGFVRLVDVFGDDSSIVQAARVSYGQGTKTTSEDEALIRYLMRMRHSTPMEMCEIKVHIRIPMDAWRQMIRTRTASVNEYCISPETKILKTDLTWIPANQLVAGDQIIGFKENGTEKGLVRSNTLDATTVTETNIIQAPCYKVTVDNGSTIIVSEGHQWIARKYKGDPYKWRMTKDLQIGHVVAFTSKPWAKATDYNAGWLSGMYDGEGWLSISHGSKKNKASNGSTSNNLHMGIAQRSGQTLDKIERLLNQYDIPHTKYIQNPKRETDRHCYTLTVQSKWNIYKLLGIISPARLLESNFLTHQAVAFTPVIITNIEYLGIQDVVALGTASKTFIAEGFPSHNSTRYSTAIEDKATTSPDQWRLQSSSNKQGSEGLLKEIPSEDEFVANLIAAGIATDEIELQLLNYNNFVDDPDNMPITEWLSFGEETMHDISYAEYVFRLGCGVARELARKDLPLSTYTEAYWKIDLHNLFHFLSLRLDPHAQLEIREFAEALAQITQDWCPLAYQAFLDYRVNAVTFSAQEMDAIHAIFDYAGPTHPLVIEGSDGTVINEIIPPQFWTTEERKEFLTKHIPTQRERKEFWSKINQ